MNNLEIAEICGRTVCLKGNLLKAYVALHKMGCPVFVREGDDEQHFFVSLETESEEVWASYYDQMYVNARLEAKCQELGVFLEWENPGCLVICNA